MRCPACGQENPEGFRLCGMCGTALAPDTPERRKLATMLFCDMSGSTAMGERVDAESVREMMFSYFHEMRGAIERHGGTVEKFIGDAVMAVFGVPMAHEDDALRAVRAAWEMQERLLTLNEQLDQRFGSTIALRIGVNTGEIVAGEGTERQALVTGDAVNVAARLEQAARPGQILIGEPTFRLVRDAVSAEPVEPLELKGKSEPLPAYRLTSVQTAAPARARRLDTPIVGRAAELELLRSRLAEAKAGHAVLATVVGEPGVGKSRLAAELITFAQADFQVLSGRCLQYGEGITYRPIAEIVHQAAGIRDEHSREEALARVEALVAGDDAGAVAQAIGLAEGEAETGDIGAAIAGLFDTLARARPLLLLVDDIHWAEEALLELLAAVPAQVADAPLLLLCLARPELVEERQWEATIRLQPLEQDDSATLVGQLLGGAVLPAALAERIAGTAAGNPLFVEELVGMLIDERLLERRNGSWAAAPGLAEFTVPPTLRELLGARLDRMPTDERSLLERGAVEGSVFHHGAVAALSDASEQATLAGGLSALTEKEFIRPAPADFADEAAYRFRHILIRDAAYESVPKKVRAGLHERYAAWLEDRAGERAAEYDEILGYHFEQAYRLREDLGPLSDTDRGLALHAAAHLGAAGGRALARRDAGAAVNLLVRAADLRPRDDPERLAMMESAGHLLIDAGELERGNSMFSDAQSEAAAAGEQLLAARLELYATWTKLLLDPSYGVSPMLAVGDRVEPALRAANDNLSLARMYDMRAYASDLRRRSAEVEREAELGIDHARLAGNRWHEVELHWWLFWQLAQGPRPVEEAISSCHELRKRIHDDEAADATFLESLAQLEAMRGRFDEARALIASAVEIRDRLGLEVLTVKYALIYLGLIELLAGEPDAAESVLRDAYERAQRSGERESESHAASLLIEALLAQSRLADAEALVPAAQEAEVGEAVAPLVRSRSARAKVLAQRGDVAGAETLARKAVELTLGTDDLNLQATALLALAEVLGAGDGAAAVAEEALELYERKGNVVSADTARAFLAALRR